MIQVALHILQRTAEFLDEDLIDIGLREPGRLLGDTRPARKAETQDNPVRNARTHHRFPFSATVFNLPTPTKSRLFCPLYSHEAAYSSPETLPV